MIAFDPNGPLLAFTAPGTVQLSTGDNVNSTMAIVTNSDTTNDCIIGWGPTAAAALLAAGAGTNQINCFYVLRNTQVPLVIPSNSFVTGLPVAGSPTIKIQAGISLK